MLTPDSMSTEAQLRAERGTFFFLRHPRPAPGPLSLSSRLRAYRGQRSRRADPIASFGALAGGHLPGVGNGPREGGDELLTVLSFPKAQWKTLQTTKTIESRRVKTQGPPPREGAALVLGAVRT